MSYINWNGETNEQKLARKKREEIELFEQAAQIRSARSAQSANGAAGAGGQLTLPDLKTINGESILGVGDIPVQEVLNSGTNIKTVNGESILGSGNISAGLPGFVGQANGTLWTRGNNNLFGSTAYGQDALRYNSQGNNTAFGESTLMFNTTGSQNVAIGVRTIKNLTTGNANIAIGMNTGTGITTGSYNIMIGDSLGQTENSSYNLFIGGGASRNGGGDFGIYNTLIGMGCQVYSDSQGSNTMIGARSRSTQNVHNAIAIGVFAEVSRNGQLSIGSASYPIEAVVSESLTPTKALKITVNGVDYKIPMQLA